MKKIEVKELISNLFKGGFFHILFGGTLSKIIFFISSIVIVRLVSKDEYAFLAYVDNIYSYILLISGLGCGSAVLKYCVSDNNKKNKAFFVFACKFGTYFQVLVMVIMLFSLNVVSLAFPESEKYFNALLLYPILYFWIGVVQSFMRARLKNRQFAIAGIIQAIVVLILSVILVFLWGIFGVICARYVASIIVILYSYVIIKDEIKDTCSAKLSKTEKKNFLKFSITLLIANIFSMVMPINESFLVNNIIQNEIITANYKVANLIPAQLSFFTTAIITYYFPIFAKEKNSEVIWKKAKSVGLLTVGLIGVITIIGIILSPIIIRIFYGEKYSDITLLMTLMWIAYSLNAGFRMIPMNILPAIGYTKFNVYMSIISCIFHFGIDFVLISYFGINGAVVAGGIVYLFSGIAYWLYLKTKLRKVKYVVD